MLLTTNRRKSTCHCRLLYSRWIKADVVRNTTSGSIIRCLEKHFARHGISETLRTNNGSNLVSHEMEEFLDELGSSIKGLFLYGLEQMGRWSEKTSHFLRQCVRSILKRNHGNENCRNICQFTDQHLTLQLVLALQSCSVWKKDPNQNARV